MSLLKLKWSLEVSLGKIKRGNREIIVESKFGDIKKYLVKKHCVAVPTETVYGLEAEEDLQLEKLFQDVSLVLLLN